MLMVYDPPGLLLRHLLAALERSSARHAIEVQLPEWVPRTSLRPSKPTARSATRLALKSAREIDYPAKRLRIT